MKVRRGQSRFNSKRELHVSEHLHIEGKVIEMSQKGEGIVRAVNSGVEKFYFVKQTYPGEIVTLNSRRSMRKKQKKQGILNRILWSPFNKLKPFCTHFGICGGCNLQDLSYDDQCTIKVQYVQNLLRSHETHLPESLKGGSSLIKSQQRMFFRNRVDYTFGSHRWLQEHEFEMYDDDRKGTGFHVKGFYDKVVHISHCFVHDSNEIRNSVHRWAMHRHLQFYNSRTHQGLLRGMIVRNTLEGAIMLILIATSTDKSLLDDFCVLVNSSFPRVESIYFVENNTPNDSVFDLPHNLLYGKESLLETCEHISLNIYPQVFYQTNSYMAPVLYEEVRTMAQLSNTMRVLDLYCGIGSIGLYIAKYVSEVVGIELIEKSVKSARENAKMNNIGNIRFVVGPVEKVLPELSLDLDDFDLVIVDPPRAGLHPNTIKYLIRYRVERLIYVSCNPASLANDIKMLSTAYRIVQWRPVDMFPHTFHLETVVLLESY